MGSGKCIQYAIAIAFALCVYILFNAANAYLFTDMHY